MDMYDLLLAAQLMSEERLGKRIREHERGEDAARSRLLGRVTN